MPPPNTEDFESKLAEILKDAKRQKLEHKDMTARRLHELTGGYPPAKGEYHAMTSCSNAMHNMRKKYRSKILYQPPQGRGARLQIRYYLPRDAGPRKTV